MPSREFHGAEGRVNCREQLARFQNGDICKLTEQVIFTDPYYSAPVNRHTSPQLDDLAASFQSDVQAKVAATALKASHSSLVLPVGPMLHQPLTRLYPCLSIS